MKGRAQLLLVENVVGAMCLRGGVSIEKTDEGEALLVDSNRLNATVPKGKPNSCPLLLEFNGRVQTVESIL